MPTIRTKDGIFLDIPDGMAPDAPEVREAVAQERAGRTRRKYTSPEYLAKTKAEGEALAGDPTQDPERPMTGRLRANFGAGMTNLWEGIKQVTPGLKGSTDEELRTKRALDKRLADSQQTGQGADWMPTAGKVTQVAGEVIPQLVASRAVPLPASPVAQGAIMGGAGGALQPVTSDESRLFNTGLGAVLGGALPLAVKGARSLYSHWSPGRRAAQELVSGLGEEAAQIPGQVAARSTERAATSPAARAIPESLAEATGSTTAGRMEAASAREMNPEWAGFRRAQNVARHGAVESALGEADLLAQRQGVRAATTDPMRDAAMAASKQDPWFHVPAAQKLEELAASDAAKGNSAVRRMLAEVRHTFDQGATPGSLYELRKSLVSRLEGPAVVGDELSAAVKGAQRQTVEMVKAIDEALNQSSGGQFGRYLETYSRASRPVGHSESAQLARDVFQKEGVREIGGVPEVTATRLGQAMRAASGPSSRQFPLTLSPSAQKGVEDVLENITHANEVGNVRKLAGTSGGGSQTSMDVGEMAHRALSPLGGWPVRALRAALDWAQRSGHQQTQRELVKMLQDPDAAVAAIQAAQRMNRPLTAAELAVVKAIGTTGGTTLPHAMQSQREGSYATR